MFIALAIPASVLNVAWRYMYPDLGQPYEALGILLMFFTVGRVVSTFIAGRVIARFGLWACVFGGISLSLAGVVGALISPTWLVLLLSILAMAFGWGIMDIGVNLFVASYYRSGILSFMHATYGIGLVLGPLVVSLVVVTLGQNWRLSYLLPALILLGLAVWTAASRAQWVLPRSSSDTSTGRGVSIRATLGLPIMVAWLLFAFLYGGLETGTGQLSSDLLINSRGLDEASASQWVSLYWASFTVGRFLTGIFAGRVSERRRLIAYAVGATIGAILLALPGTPFALPGMLIIGLSLAGTYPTLIGMAPRRFGPDHAPNAVGFTAGVTSAGVAVLPGLGAFLAARIDFAVIAPFLVAIGVLLIGAYLLILRQLGQQAAE